MTDGHGFPLRELEGLYPEEEHIAFAEILGVRSAQGCGEVKDQILRIARAYHSALIEARRRPANRETGATLKKIRKLNQELQEALHSNAHAQSEVAYAISKTRPNRVLSSGEAVIPYRHPCSNEHLFDRENMIAFTRELESIDAHLSAIIEELKKGGAPRKPEKFAVGELMKLWKKCRGKEPTLSGKREGHTGEFVDFCKAVLGRIALKYGPMPNFASAARAVIYGQNPPGK
jgi:hypothetical protein